ncbi:MULTISPECIES: type VI secretion system Vgr family protein [unclassified Variovorax]|uniref:type VI secretion system Vgr family protein n=1 Tax=unclassified Variovorax TaxID=663243 RepID=UPI003F45C9FE
MQRTLSVQSPAIPLLLGQPTLEPVRLAGHEGLDSLFAYELLLKTPDALNLGASGAMDFDADTFIGCDISCSIQLDGAGQFLPGAVGASVDGIGAGVRQINAQITGVEVVGEEGRHVQYKLTLRPWLHCATLTTDCKIFQNKTVVQILDELLADYNFPVDKRLIETYPPRDYQVQFNESDFAFFSRLCQKWGISYFFEHGEGKHRLVLIDNMGAYKKNDSAAYQEVEYHAPGWKADAEYVSSFVSHYQLTSGRYATRNYDYTRPGADLSVGRSDPRHSGQADGEVYQWHEGSAAGSHYAQPRAGASEANDPHAEGRQLALLRVQALCTHGARARASGNLRGMVPGCSFLLQKHPRQKANTEYLILDTRFLIEDIAQDSQVGDASPGRKQQWRVEVDFAAHQMTEPLRPAPTQARPLTHGLHTAVVVGPPGQNIWTDEYARIKVQFPWDRIGRKDQHSSCWIRVTSSGAGNQQGTVHIPRIGQEVTIGFIGSDPDQPICIGQAYNQSNKPSWNLPDQQALSGYRSRELIEQGGNSAAGRSNHLSFDDTSGKIQVQLKSDHGHSQLSMGHIARIEDNAGRKDLRGEGVELRTDGHGAIRAAQGLLITTEGRANARAHITDMSETTARLTQAREHHEGLSGSALQAEAHSSGDQDEVTQALKVQNDAIKGGTPASKDGFPELAEPHLVLASPAGIASTTSKSTHIASVEHNALTSGGHTSISAAKSFLVSARQAVRLFAYQAGMRLFAFGGNIDIKALKESINILAKLDIVQVANRITITAKEELVLNGGGSTIRLNAAGIEEATSGKHVEYAAVHSMVGPKNAPTRSVSGLSSLDLKEKGTLSFVLISHAQDGRPLGLEPYTLFRDGAKVADGITDADGRVLIEDHQSATTSYKVRLSNGNEYELPVRAQLKSNDDRLAAAGYRAAHGDTRNRMQHYLRHSDEEGNP